MPNVRTWSFLAVFVVILALNSSFAQSQPNVENGFKAYGSYDGSGIDTVNAMNGNLMLHLPMPFTYPQRGGRIAPQNVLTVTSKQWAADCRPDAGGTLICGWNPDGGVQAMLTTIGNGVGFDQTMDMGLVRTLEIDGGPDGSNPSYSAYGYSLNTADGASHQLQVSTTDTNALDVIDTSGYHIDLTTLDPTGVPSTAMVVDRHGNRYQLASFGSSICSTSVNNDLPGNSMTTICNQSAGLSAITDVNGNFYGSADTMGRTFLSLTGRTQTTDSSGCVTGGFPLSSVYISTYVGFNGVVNQIKQCNASVTLQTAFSQPGIGEVGPATVPQLATLVLPTGDNWNFQYDNYGNITRVGLPLGGSISYTWTEIAQPSCGSLTMVSRAVSSRTVNDNNGNASTWHYSWGSVANGTVTNVITDPQNNDTKYIFTALDGSSGCGFYETSRLSYQGSSTSGQLLQQVDTGYSKVFFTTSTGSGSGLGNVVATSIRTTLYPSGKVSLVTKSYDSGLGPNRPIFGNVTTEKHYDFGQGAPGALLRETHIVYQWQKDNRYLAANILDLPASVVIVDPVPGNNSKSNCPIDAVGTAIACAAEEDFAYDELGYLQLYTGALPAGTHGAPPNPVRGNLTTISKWLNTTGSSVATHAVWYDTGEKSEDIDPLGYITTYFYDPVYAGAFVTKTCNAANQCASSTYDFMTALLTSFTERNGSFQATGNTPGDPAHTTFYTYDFMGRFTSTSFPDGGQTTVDFPTSNRIDTRTTISAGNTDLISVFLDGLGRQVQTQHPTPQGVVRVDTAYDGLSRVLTVTNPYLSNSDETYGFTQHQYDALGRITKIIKQDGGTGTLDYSDGNCITSSDEANKQHRNCSNAAGQLVEVDEPGAGFPGLRANGSLSIVGTLQTASGSTVGTGSVSISGAEKSTQLLTHAATGASITVQVGGSNGTETTITTTCSGLTKTCHSITHSSPDNGSMQIVVNVGGTVITSGLVSYDNTRTQASLAAALAQALPANSLVTASYIAGATRFTLTTTATGNSTNSTALATSIASSCVPGTTGDSIIITTSCSQTWTITPGQNFNGGTDNSYSLVYDAGTVTVNVNGHSNQISYGQNDSLATIATNLQNTINADTTAFVTATLDPIAGRVNLRSKTAGSSTNVPLSTSVTFDGAHFGSQGASFSSISSGSTLTGGASTGGASVTDSGTVTLTIGSFTATTTYGPAPDNNTVALVASALAGAGPTGLNRAGSPVTANAAGASINLTYNTAGVAGNVAVTVTGISSDQGHFAIASFGSPQITLSGGVNPDSVGLATSPLVTLFIYDGQGNLTCAVQKASDTTGFTSCAAAPATWRPRSFTYDSLGRVLTVTNPETGIFRYTYDADNNVISTTAPAPNQSGLATVTTSFVYDSLKRLMQRSHSDTTSTAKFGFDGVAPPGCTPPALTVQNAIGRMTSMCDAAGSETWSYDQMGRPKIDVRTTNGITRATSYSYNVDGSLNQLTTPGGRSITYAYDPIGRPISALDVAANLNYVSGGTYNAIGSIRSVANGTGIVSTLYYNNRLQPCRISIGNSGIAPTNCSDMVSIGNILDYTYDFGLNVSDNGNLNRIANNRDATRNQSFTYDAINRLTTAQTDSPFSASAAHCWGESFLYDDWGNLLSINSTGSQYNGCLQENLQVSVTARNQLLASMPCYDASGALITTTTFCYDAAGNLLTDGSGRMNTFNAEHKLVSTAGVNYVYDGRGNRVIKSNGKLYWYGAGRTPLDETDLAGNLTDEYVFFGGKRIARRHVTAGQADSIFYYLSDHLNTARVVTNSAGLILDDIDFFPYGGARPYLSSSGNSYLFTGVERDAESGLDNFGARFEQSSIGRFVSPDAVFMTIDRASEPQRLNMYSYGADNPLRYVDPTGATPIPSTLINKINNLETTARAAALQLIADSRSGKPMVISQHLGHLLGEAGYYEKQRDADRSGCLGDGPTMCKGADNGYNVALDKITDIEVDELMTGLVAQLDEASKSASLLELDEAFIDIAAAQYGISPDDPNFNIEQLKKLSESALDKVVDEITDKIFEKALGQHGPWWKKVVEFGFEWLEDTRQSDLRTRALSRLLSGIMLKRGVHSCHHETVVENQYNLDQTLKSSKTTTSLVCDQ